MDSGLKSGIFTGTDVFWSRIDLNVRSNTFPLKMAPVQHLDVLYGNFSYTTVR